MEWFFHCKNGSLRKHNSSVPCFVLLSNNYVIVKAFSRNIMACTNLAYSEKVNLQVSIELSLSRPSFIPWQRKVGKIELLCDKTFCPSFHNFCYSEFSYITAAY